MSAMINLEIPHINVMSKMDLLPKMKARELERYVPKKNGSIFFFFQCHY